MCRVMLPHMRNEREKMVNFSSKKSKTKRIIAGTICAILAAGMIIGLLMMGR